MNPTETPTLNRNEPLRRRQARRAQAAAPANRLHRMKICLPWMLVLAWVVAGCTPGQPEQKGPEESFGQLISEFKDRAAKKLTNGLTITITEQLAADRHPTAAATGTIQVRKQTPGGVPGNARKTAEIIDLHFVYETNRWRCSGAESKDLEGDKVTSQYSLGGPDIRLGNLFIWSGL